MAGYEAFQLVVSFLQDLHLRERDRPEVSASELGVEAASVYQYIAHLITVTFGRTITDGTAVSAHGSNLSHITGGQGTRWFHSDSVRMVFRCRISGREDVVPSILIPSSHEPYMSTISSRMESMNESPASLGRMSTSFSKALFSLTYNLPIPR